jgi:Holliday junction DNA helicase RuvB
MTSPSPFERLAAKHGIVAPKPRALRVVSDEPEPEVVPEPPSKRLSDVIGQPELTMRLGSLIRSAKLRGQAAGHVFLDGAPGFGKTLIAQAVHGELVAEGVASTFHQVMPNALPDARSLAITLSMLRPNDVLFLDEVHSVHHSVQEGLYNAMQDGFAIMPSEDGPQTVQLAPFTLIAATTEPGSVLAPLRNRFKFHAHIEPYAVDDLAMLLLSHCEEAGIHLDVDAALVIAGASRSTPRKALELLGAVQVYSDDLTGDPAAVLDAETALQGMEYAGVDQYGLDGRDRRVLQTLATTFKGGPIGINPLATALGMNPRELSADVEPFLIQSGRLALRRSGRSTTRDSYPPLDLSVPPILNAWR